MKKFVGMNNDNGQVNELIIRAMELSVKIEYAVVIKKYLLDILEETKTDDILQLWEDAFELADPMALDRYIELASDGSIDTETFLKDLISITY